MIDVGRAITDTSDSLRYGSSAEAAAGNVFLS